MDPNKYIPPEVCREHAQSVLCTAWGKSALLNLKSHWVPHGCSWVHDSVRLVSHCPGLHTKSLSFLYFLTWWMTSKLTAMWVIKAFRSVCPSSFIFFFCLAPESQWWCWFSDLLASLQAFDHADYLLKSISSQQISLRQAVFSHDLHFIAQLSLHSVAALGSLSNLGLFAEICRHGAGLTFFPSLLLIIQTKICALCFRCDPNSLFWRFCRLQVPKVKPSP